MLDEDEFLRWVEMAKSTLESARGDLERGDYNWSCFKAHQSAEYSVKALLHGLGMEAYGHSVSRLLSAIPKELDTSNLIQGAKTLDKYYIPTRYPNAWPEGTPRDYFTKQDAEKAINYAEEIIKWVEDSWKSLRGGRSIGER